MKYFLSVVLFLVISTAKAQVFIDWGMLADVRFEEEFSESYGMNLLRATFGPMIEDHDDEEVMITGYLIPIDPMGTAYVLSRNPNSSCFFCGGAGPETIVGLRLHPEHTKRYKTDEYLTFKGTLRLNELNSQQFTYMLLDAKKMD